MFKRIFHLLVGFLIGSLITGGVIWRLWSGNWTPALPIGCLILAVVLVGTSLHEDGNL